MCTDGALLMVAIYVLAANSIINVHTHELMRQDDSFGNCLMMIYRVTSALFVLYYAWVGIKATLNAV